MCCPLWDTPRVPLNPPAWETGDFGGFLVIFGVLEVRCGFCWDGVPTAGGGEAEVWLWGFVAPV